ncbi:MAG: protein phosphatase 2C domain-containing protein [Pseudomonadota bacterium]
MIPRWTSDAATHPGYVRHQNEDALFDGPSVGLWAVADGMGGHAAGDVASSTIVERLEQLKPADTLSHFTDDVEDALLGANARLREIAIRRNGQTIGSTVVALLIRGRFALCLWAGDSRAYHLRGEQITQITQDHTLIEEFKDSGLLSSDEAEAHPQANLVTKAIGAHDDLFLDMEMVEIAPGDRFVLCSDGLDLELTPEEIRTVVSGAPDAPATALVDRALSNECRDNVTAVVVCIDPDPDLGLKDSSAGSATESSRADRLMDVEQ